MHDVLVAGGGPVGLATALCAARAGLEVTVWEPRRDVIDKACGEGLMPGALAALRDLGVDPPGQPLTGIRYLSDAHTAQARFRSGSGRGVRRTTLHAALRAAVDEAGISVVSRPVTDVEQDDAAVHVGGLSARYLVAADGLHSTVRRDLGLERPVLPRPRYGLRSHVQMEPWTSYVEVHWSASCEAYVTPVAPDLVGVAILTRTREPFETQLRAFPGLERRIVHAPRQKVRGAGPLHRRSRRRVAGRVLLVGDASGYVDALTGEGIALGLAQARAAVRAIEVDRPTDYELSWQQITWRYRLMTSCLVRSSRVPVLRRGIVPAAAAYPGVFSAAVNALARPA